MSIRIVLSTPAIFSGRQIRSATFVTALTVFVGVGVLSGARAQAQGSAADGPWSGYAQCQLNVTGANSYTNQQIHTWTLTRTRPAPSPTPDSPFKNYPATWTVTGSGSWHNGPTNASWTVKGESTRAPITFYVHNDGSLRIVSRHEQQRAAGAATSATGSSIAIGYDVDEFAFPIIADDTTATEISGSSSRPLAGSIAPGQPPGSSGTAACSWKFSRSEVLPPPPPLSSGGPNTPPPGIAVPPPAQIVPPGAISRNDVPIPRGPGGQPAPPPGTENKSPPDSTPIRIAPVPAKEDASPPVAAPRAPLPTGPVAAALRGKTGPTGDGPPADNKPTTSGTYLVTATGLLAGAATSDDPLSSDGKGDEIYAAAIIRHYDRRNSQVLESESRQTFVYGDTNNAPDRQIAGSMSTLGGIRDLDKIPKDMSVARVAAAQEGIFPWRLWQGTLTDGVDAVIISPSVWESDSSPRIFTQWVQNQNALTNSLFTRQQVLNQINGPRFGPFNLDPVAGAPVRNQALEIALTFVSGTLSAVVQGTSTGDKFDRPIGLIPNGVGSVALANPVVVLTREIIEAALKSPSNLPIPTPTAGLIVVAPKPGIMVINFADGDMTNTGERSAAYYMVLQVERL